MGLRCIAAPIFGHDDKVFAALSLSGSVSQITGDSCTYLADKVKGAAAIVSANLKARWSAPETIADA